MSAERAETTQLDRLQAALKECANDLEAEIDARYGRPVHPALAHQYERDMEPVQTARAILAELADQRPTPPDQPVE